MEIWKQALNSYDVSNLGRIRNRKSGKIINGSTIKGYISVRDTNKKSHSIHRLVARLFIREPKDKEVVNHKNGIKNDNRVENLEWCTQSENNHHAKNMPNYQSKLKNRYKEHETIEILKLNHVYGLNCREIADVYGRSKWSIRKVLTQTHHLYKAVSL